MIAIPLVFRRFDLMLLYSANELDFLIQLFQILPPPPVAALIRRPPHPTHIHGTRLVLGVVQTPGRKVRHL